jgi:hypothetical protein
MQPYTPITEDQLGERVDELFEQTQLAISNLNVHKAIKAQLEQAMEHICWEDIVMQEHKESHKE